MASLGDTGFWSATWTDKPRRGEGSSGGRSGDTKSRIIMLLNYILSYRCCKGYTGVGGGNERAVIYQALRMSQNSQKRNLKIDTLRTRHRVPKNPIIRVQKF